jgi:hypothetical protein
VSLCVDGKLLPRLRELSLGPLPIEMWSLGSSALGVDGSGLRQQLGGAFRTRYRHTPSSTQVLVVHHYEIQAGAHLVQVNNTVDFAVLKF